jgi:hypothetical protein
MNGTESGFGHKRRGDIRAEIVSGRSGAGQVQRADTIGAASVAVAMPGVVTLTGAACAGPAQAVPSAATQAA